jgi:hypothetical protein
MHIHDVGFALGQPAFFRNATISSAAEIGRQPVTCVL